MKLSVLLSAMFLKDENYIDSLNINSDCVVINQCDDEAQSVISHSTPGGEKINVCYVKTRERGLSKSRNMAIAHSDGDVCILCDNDVEYEAGYEKMITSAYERHPDADVIVFFIKRPERSTPVFDRDKRMGYLSVLKIFSPEVSFKKESIKGIRFNESFGAGAKYIMGEENIFLYECLKRHLKVIYVPCKIASVRQEESTWFKGYTQEFFISRGANYAAMSRLFSIVLILQFALRKKSLYSDRFTTGQTIKMMFRGRKMWLKESL